MRNKDAEGITEQRLKAAGRLAAIRHGMEELGRRLQRLSLWRPAVGLAQQAAEAGQLVESIRRRLDRKLVVTLIGPSGSGKSTLLNALAGVDDLSPTGLDRPTTRQVVVFGRDRADADAFGDRIDGAPVRMRTAASAAALEHLVLVDTPDTDSREAESHREVLDRVIASSDVLLCVFDAENPKRRDHVDFLAPYVQRFDGASLIAVLNRCDRLAEDELAGRIVPDFSAHLGRAWQREVDTVFCTAARRHLKQPNWDESATPRHEFDQFEALRRRVLETFNQAVFVVDRRLTNAGSLMSYIEGQILSAVDQDKEAVDRAAALIVAAEKAAAQSGFEALESEVADARAEIHTALYGRLAQRWVGPVGWLTATWARLLAFGSGVAAVMRGAGSSVLSVAGRLAKTGQKEAGGAGRAFGGALLSYRHALAERWPDISEALVQGRFDPSVRRFDQMLPDLGGRLDSLSGRWEDALSTEIDRAAAGLSHPVFQLLLNLPAVAVLLHAGWRTVVDYFAGRFLPVSFFLHTLLMLGIALFLSFFVLQTLIRMAAGQKRILARTLKRAIGSTEALHPMTESPFGEKIEDFFILEAMVKEGRQVSGKVSEGRDVADDSVFVRWHETQAKMPNQ